MTNYGYNIYERRYKLRPIVPRDENIQIEQNTSATFPCSRENTYIIGHYNPSVRIIDLVSRTTYVVCVLIS